MSELELKRGYEVLPDNNIRFGIRVINSSDYAISDVEVILDYSETLFVLEGSKVQKLGTIPPTTTRTAEFILKPRGCIHKEEIGVVVIYKDHQWKRHTQEMRPKEVHCVCPYLKEKSLTRADFLALSNSGYLEERGVNFEGISVNKLVDFIFHTCKSRLYRVDEFSIDRGKILYLAGDALGEKAYYLLTAVVNEHDGITQVMLRAASDKKHGLNGFLNEIVDNLRHLVSSVASAREIGIIKKEQVINIIDSVVQRTSFAAGEGAASVTIKDSVVQRTEIKGDEEAKRRRDEEERLRREKEEQERLRRQKDREEQERLRREEEEWKQREKKAREDAEKRKREGEKRASEELKTREAERGTSQKKILAVILVLSAMLPLLGYWMLAPDSTDAPELSKTKPLPAHTVTPPMAHTPEVTQTVSQTPTPAANQKETITNTIGMEFVLIPAGEFEMGSPSDEAGRYSDEGPVHHVNIEKAFYMGKYEVTQKQWREIMGSNPSNFKGDDLPVETVSWNDVQEFIKKLNEKEGTDKYRLPSEAEWEYACRAGTTTGYSFGDDESKLGDYAWYYENSGDKTHPVGQKKPNQWGLYDMHGNVWEWVLDKWHSDYDGVPTDGSAWESGDGADRVSRGGCWRDGVGRCRSASRYCFDSGARRYALGFRLLRST